MNALTIDQILQMIPQRKPFRFVDEIHELTDSGIRGSYQFKPIEPFYEGHFPGNPVTPGVILLETMAQFGVVALAIHWLGKELPLEEISTFVPYFTDANVEFLKPVFPSERVQISAKLLHWRRGQIRSEAKLFLENGECAAWAVLSGLTRRKVS